MCGHVCEFVRMGVFCDYGHRTYVREHIYTNVCVNYVSWSVDGGVRVCLYVDVNPVSRAGVCVCVVPGYKRVHACRSASIHTSEVLAVPLPAPHALRPCCHWV